MARRSKWMRTFVELVPGKRTFGIYRFIPLFFVLGASIEFAMIKWTVGETNFYRVYKRNQAAIKAKELFEEEKKAQENNINLN